ncbi:MAG: Arylsulfatase [Planctomycetes bacterium ADurb.Bin126]|nr:MAG: Arylsulfatase [Planctomycetes bacterium ADurb.Bin126]HOD81660.1 arylsulfatase [Phycisphaerae bacterium]HQL74791.1 arylsulfatase [Phycisphaerae bacterium]
MNRRDFLKWSALSAVAASAGRLPAQNAAAQRRPNVLVILTDDQGWGDLRVHGNTNLQTPNVDSLAREGALFDRFFVCPVCAPTRAELLTGRYHLRGGVHGVSTGQERLNLDERTIADAFRKAGYATGCFGKWHNGTQYPYHPNGRGFDEFYGFTSGHWGQYFDPPLDHNGKHVRGKGFIIDDLTDHAVEFMGRHVQADKPFLCYLAFNTPHSPFQVPDKYWDRFKDRTLGMLADPAADKKGKKTSRENIQATRCVLAMCENIDWNVGRLLKRLDELKIAQDTIVVFFTDNGPNGWRWNGGMKGIKGWTDEGGVRVPCLIRWPGRIEGGTKIPQIAGAIDLLPTLATLCGVRPVGDKPLDGRDLSPLLAGMKPDWPERYIFTHQNGRFSVRSQQYRLDAQGKLFDMAADPGQTRDVAGDKPQVAARLAKALEDFRKSLPPMPDTRYGGKDDRPFPIGHPDWPTAWLPARDATFTGKLRRSSRHPNCSYFIDWKSTDDRIAWDVDVLTGGRYEVAAWYTCPSGDVGSTVELSMSGSSLRAKVDKAFDPPLWDKDDRVPRGEGYLKEFRPLKLGTIKLDKGRGSLVLKAAQVAGGQVMDLRAVELTLLKN